MPIVIKELFPSDPISEALEKINFNFDQLLLAGGGPPGPQGPIGPAGIPGPQGNRGDHWQVGGASGVLGYTGPTSDHGPLFGPLQDTDHWLDVNGLVWKWNDATNAWNNTGVNLTGPTGSAGSVGGSLEWKLYLGSTGNALNTGWYPSGGATTIDNSMNNFVAILNGYKNNLFLGDNDWAYNSLLNLANFSDGVPGSAFPKIAPKTLIVQNEIDSHGFGGLHLLALGLTGSTGTNYTTFKGGSTASVVDSNDGFNIGFAIKNNIPLSGPAYLTHVLRARTNTIDFEIQAGDFSPLSGGKTPNLILKGNKTIIGDLNSSKKDRAIFDDWYSIFREPAYFGYNLMTLPGATDSGMTLDNSGIGRNRGNFYVGDLSGSLSSEIGIGYRRPLDADSTLNFYTRGSLPTYPNLAISRLSGVNGASNVTHSGTGTFNFFNQNIADFKFWINSILKANIVPSGMAIYGDSSTSQVLRVIGTTGSYIDLVPNTSTVKARIGFSSSTSNNLEFKTTQSGDSILVNTQVGGSIKLWASSGKTLTLNANDSASFGDILGSSSRVEIDGTDLSGTTFNDNPLLIRTNRVGSILGRNSILFQKGLGPITLSTGSILGSLSFGGWDGFSWSSGWNGGAQIVSRVVGPGWSTVSKPADISFLTTNLGSTSATESMKINPNGRVTIGTQTLDFSSLNYELSFPGNGAKSIGIERTIIPGGTGNNLTIQAGGALGTDLPGGTLILSGGRSVGARTSEVWIVTSNSTGPGTTYNTIDTSIIPIRVVGNNVGINNDPTSTRSLNAASSPLEVSGSIGIVQTALSANQMAGAGIKFHYFNQNSTYQYARYSGIRPYTGAIIPNADFIGLSFLTTNNATPVERMRINPDGSVKIMDDAGTTAATYVVSGGSTGSTGITSTFMSFPEVDWDRSVYVSSGTSFVSNPIFVSTGLIYMRYEMFNPTTSQIIVIKEQIFDSGKNWIAGLDASFILPAGFLFRVVGWKQSLVFSTPGFTFTISAVAVRLGMQ